MLTVENNISQKLNQHVATSNFMERGSAGLDEKFSPDAKAVAVPLQDEIIRALKQIAFEGLSLAEDRLILVDGGDTVHELHAMLAESNEFNVLMAGTGPVIEQLKKARDKR